MLKFHTTKIKHSPIEKKLIFLPRTTKKWIFQLYSIKNNQIQPKMGIEEKIKQIRSFKKLKQEEIAEKLNISPQAYSKIERGETKLDMERLEQLANIFEMSVEDIYKLAENQQFMKFNDFFNRDNTINTINHNYNNNDKIIEFLEKRITKQNEEINFLREQIVVFASL